MTEDEALVAETRPTLRETILSTVDHRWSVVRLRRTNMWMVAAPALRADREFYSYAEAIRYADKEARS